jgi:DNA-binding CsgD family transcriptional regulator
MHDAQRRLSSIAADSSNHLARMHPPTGPTDPLTRAGRGTRRARTPIERAAELEEQLHSADADPPVTAVDVAASWLDARRPVQAQALVAAFSQQFTEAEANWILAGSAWQQGDFALVDQLVGRGIELSGHEDRVLGELEQLAARMDLEVRYDAAAAIVHADRAIAHLERVGRSTAGPLATRCRADMLAGRDGSAMALSDAVAAAAAGGDIDGAIHLLRAQFASLAFFGHPAEAEDALGVLEQLAARHQRHGDLVSAKGIRAGLALFLHGDAVGAERLCRELEGEPLSHRAGRHLVAVRGIALADTGRLRMAERLLQAELRRPESPATLAAVHAALAEVHLAAANYRSAHDHATAAIADGAPVAPVIIGAVAAQAWAQFGLGGPVSAPPGEAPYPAVAGATAEVRALATWADGDAGSASAQFTQAASAWSSYNRRGELRCLWAAAWTSAEAGQEQDAVDALLLLEDERALPVWMGDVVRRSLRQLGVPRRLLDRSGASAITQRERQVLELAGHGYSARRIADQLRISESTVNSIVRSASDRLGARNRLHASSISAGRPDLSGRVVICGPEHIEPCRSRLRELGVDAAELASGGGDPVHVGVVGDPGRLQDTLVVLTRGAHCIIGADSQWALVVADAVHRLRLGVVRLIDEPESDPDLMASFTLTLEEQTVLAAMASGLTLAEAALVIGFSRRTAARRLADAKQRLGSDSAAHAIERWAEFTR